MDVKLYFHSTNFLAITLLFYTMPIESAQPFNEIIAFGDSPTDVGNVAGLKQGRRVIAGLVLRALHSTSEH